jgi:hypothetical protein
MDKEGEMPHGFHKVAGAIRSSTEIINEDAKCVLCGEPATAIVISWDRGRPACEGHADAAEQRNYPVNRNPRRRASGEGREGR